MSSSFTPLSEGVDSLLLVQRLLGIYNRHTRNGVQVNEVSEDNAFNNIVFLSINVKSSVTTENNTTTSTGKFEISLLDKSELTGLQPGHDGITWISRISTKSVASRVHTRVAQMPRNAVTDGIKGLKEQLRGSRDVKYVLVYRHTDTTYTRFIKHSVSGEDANQVLLVNLRDVYTSARRLVTRYAGPSSLQNILNILQLEDDISSSAHHPSALILKALVIIAVESRDAHIRNATRESLSVAPTPTTSSQAIARSTTTAPLRTAAPTRIARPSAVAPANPAPSPALPTNAAPPTNTALPSNAAPPTTGSVNRPMPSFIQRVQRLSARLQRARLQRAPAPAPSAARRYASRAQIDVPEYINRYTSEGSKYTDELAHWIVQEAGVFIDVNEMYEMDGDITRLLNTSRFIVLARVISVNKAAVGALEWAIDALNTALYYRREVTNFFLEFSCVEGSELDEVAKVLEILKTA